MKYSKAHFTAYFHQRMSFICKHVGYNYDLRLIAETTYNLDRLASLLTTSIELTECLLRKSTDSISHRERIKLCYSQYCNNPSFSNQNNCDAKVITKMIRRTLGTSLRNTGFQKSSKGIHYNGFQFG